MKKEKLLIIVFLLIFFNFQPLWAQEQITGEKPEFKINAQLRNRINVLHGYKKLPTEESIACLVVEQRTRLGFWYKTQLLEMNVEIQDARIWGDENLYSKTGIWGDSSSIDLKEAWAAIRLNDFWKFKIGRQEIQLDDGRLLGKRNWNNHGTSYDAAIVKFSKSDFEMDIAMSYNNSSMNLFASEYNSMKIKSMNYIYLKKKFSKDLSVSLSSIFSGFQPDNSATVIQFKTTVGTFIKYDNKKFYAKGELYYQLGKTIDAVDVRAYFFNAETGYHINKIYLAAGIDYMSGQDPNVNRSDKFQAFDILYGARFKYYGNLNYIVTPASTKYGGIVNPFVRFNTQFNKKNILDITFHMLQTAQDVENTSNQGTFYNKNLGSELDMIYTHKVARGISIKAGYHLAFPTETMEIFKGVEQGKSKMPQYFWLMFTFKPTFFSFK